MVDVQSFGHQPVLGRDHVSVCVVGKVHAQPIGGLGGPAVTNVVREDDVVGRGVERLAGPVQLGEERVEELAAGTPGAVQDQYRVADVTGRVPAGRPQREIVELERCQGFAVGEVEIVEQERGGVALGLKAAGSRRVTRTARGRRIRSPG